MNGAMVKEWLRHVFALPPALTARQQQLIRTNFAKMLPDRENAATLFRERLFALDPQLRMLLDTDMKERDGRLIATMGSVVDQCDRLRQLVPALRELGRRYDDYGATDRDYDTVATALISTLEETLGANFTAETREAWTTWYGMLADEMKSAAREKKLPLLPPC